MVDFLGFSADTCVSVNKLLHRPFRSVPAVCFLASLDQLKTAGLSGSTGVVHMDVLAVLFSEKGGLQYFTALGDVCFRFSVDPLYLIKKVERKDFRFFFLRYPSI